MKVTIIGSGYVGLVTGACLADFGNDVLCVDVDAAKVARLKAGEIGSSLQAEVEIRQQFGKAGIGGDAAR